MKRGTLLALIAAGFAGWCLGRQAAEVTRSEARLHLEPQPEPGEPPATPEPPERDTIAAARTTVSDAPEAPEPAAGSGPAADTGRSMRQARSAVDQRMRTLRARPSKSA